jgi:hypothetical protein
VSKRFEDATVAFARIDQRVAAHQARYELCRVSPIGRSAMNSRRLALVAAALAVALVGSACTNDSQSATPAATAATGGSLGLKGVCPDTIVVQKDWQPESEHGFLYNLVGAGYKVDTNNKRVTGPLVAQGRDTGVNLQIRSGGPAVGFQPVSAVMYSDRSIHLGYVATDEAVQFAARQPTTAVMAQLDISPLALIWDLATYPQFTTIADIGQTNTQVLYTDGLTYMEYLVGSNILHRSQLNGSYDGSPALFVQSNGKAALQGFATSEPYLYEHEIKQWGKPLKFQLINDTGYPVYFAATSIRSGDKTKLSPCLAKLVPILQQSQVDFINNPKPAIDVIVDLVEEYKTGWVYSRGLAEYSAKAMKGFGIVDNGRDATLGNFEMERVRRVIEIVTPIFAGQRKPVKQGLKPEDIATNEFIDSTIRLP